MREVRDQAETRKRGLLLKVERYLTPEKSSPFIEVVLGENFLTGTPPKGTSPGRRQRTFARGL